jgi:hypothetical protein
MIGQCLGFGILAGFILGLFFTVTVPFELRRMAEARGWPSQKGIITKSVASRKTGLLQRPYWAAEICGLYKDNGVGFCVSRVRYGEFRFGDGEAASLAAVATYPLGKEVDVYYAPYDSTTTILEPHASPSTMVITLALGIGLVFLPVLLFVLRSALAP